MALISAFISRDRLTIKKGSAHFTCKNDTVNMSEASILFGGLELCSAHFTDLGLLQRYPSSPISSLYRSVLHPLLVNAPLEVSNAKDGRGNAINEARCLQLLQKLQS